MDSCPAERGVGDHGKSAGILSALLARLPLGVSPRPEVRGFSSCFGTASTGGPSPKAIVTRATRMNKDLLKEINLALQALDDFPAGFVYNAIQAAHDTRVELHCDKGNDGPSVAFASGNFEGGDLVVSGETFKLKNCCVAFDGRLPHSVTPYTGERRSLVAFSSPWFSHLTSEDVDFLKECGFPFPEDSDANAQADSDTKRRRMSDPEGSVISEKSFDARRPVSVP